VIHDEEAKRNTHRSRREKHRRLREVTKGAVSAAKRRSVAHGQRQTNQIAVVGRKAEEVAGKSAAKQVPGKVDEKAVGNNTASLRLGGPVVTTPMRARINWRETEQRAFGVEVVRRARLDAWGNVNRRLFSASFLSCRLGSLLAKSSARLFW
jgi:hypothetical protein